ncbi:unnamed protein product [Caretta caretta]
MRTRPCRGVVSRVADRVAWGWQLMLRLAAHEVGSESALSKLNYDDKSEPVYASVEKGDHTELLGPDPTLTLHEIL